MYFKLSRTIPADGGHENTPEITPPEVNRSGRAAMPTLFFSAANAQRCPRGHHCLDLKHRK
jgi:hypothetical protein